MVPSISLMWCSFNWWIVKVRCASKTARKLSRPLVCIFGLIYKAETIHQDWVHDRTALPYFPRKISKTRTKTLHARGNPRFHKKIVAFETRPKNVWEQILGARLGNAARLEFRNWSVLRDVFEKWSFRGECQVGRNLRWKLDGKPSHSLEPGIKNA